MVASDPTARACRDLAAMFQRIAARYEAEGEWRLAGHHFAMAAAYERLAVRAEKTAADDGQDSPAS